MLNVNFAEMKKAAVDTTAENLSTLTEALENEKISSALKLRIINLSTTAIKIPAVDNYHSAHCHAYVFSDIVSTKRVSNLSINDTTPEGFVSLVDISRMGSDDPLKVYRYSKAHFTPCDNELGEFEDVQLYVMSPSLMAEIDHIYPNAGSVSWAGRAQVRRKEGVAICPFLYIRGIEPDYEEITLEQAIQELNIPDQFAKVLLDNGQRLIQAKTIDATETISDFSPPEHVAYEDKMNQTAITIAATHASESDYELNMLAEGNSVCKTIKLSDDVVIARTVYSRETELLFSSAEAKSVIQKVLGSNPTAEELQALNTTLHHNVLTKFLEQKPELAGKISIKLCFFDFVPGQAQDNYVFGITSQSPKGPHGLHGWVMHYTDSVELAEMISDAIRDLVKDVDGDEADLTSSRV